ncbi:hypothetical protein [Achromobacter xylosoxidans]|uniref:hypothetical protein n=1 Tax=Alcaligenes xylosoxydans xylosoxydans TaxID=85698 RepID=UPI002A75D62F|nr:hypothetical protein [Achromobacter xylosoxidans]WPQ33674.1 hypothetical protein SLH34_24055 [Achromobacter xylosoxidans]
MNYLSTFTAADLAGHRAAEAWYLDLVHRADAAGGNFVPSMLRETHDALPEAARGGFLDAIGALLVTAEISGDPVAGAQNLTEDIYMYSLSPAEQRQFVQEGPRDE